MQDILQKIFESKASYNTWLLELTESEKQSIIDMMEESMTFGYDSAKGQQ